MNGVRQFAGNCPDGGAVRLAFSPLLLIEGPEDRVDTGSDNRRHPDSPTQVRRAAFGQAIVRAGELTGLLHGRIQAGEGHQLLGVGEAIDVANLTQDNGSGRRPHTGDGLDHGIQLLHLQLDLLIDLANLLFGEFDLFDQDADLESEGIGTQ